MLIAFSELLFWWNLKERDRNSAIRIGIVQRLRSYPTFSVFDIRLHDEPQVPYLHNSYIRKLRLAWWHRPHVLQREAQAAGNFRQPDVRNLENLLIARASLETISDEEVGVHYLRLCSHLGVRRGCSRRTNGLVRNSIPGTTYESKHDSSQNDAPAHVSLLGLAPLQ